MHTIYFYLHEKEYAEDADRFYLSIKKLLMKANTIRGVCNEASRDAKFTKYNKLVKKRFVNFPIPGNIEVYGDKMLIIIVVQDAGGISDNI